MIITVIFVLSPGISFFITKPASIGEQKETIPTWKITVIALGVGVLFTIIGKQWRCFIWAFIY
jgi:hypothetical protein